ncbi:MAG TPA: HisA/HisF-related TIM barrel protein [Actinomycetota bacterium]|nr:HisA/HisF-related TIM barrel protein [Actinomycetota bacterium]
MAFAVIPAIDVTHGVLGRYTPDGPLPVGGSGGDPVAAAARCVAAGARWIHVVDMDLAFGAAAPDTDPVRAIAGSPEAPAVQASGGIRTAAQVGAFLTAGAARIVLGSGALVDAGAARDALEAAGGRAIVGIEVDGGRIRSRGADPIDLDLMTTVGWLSALPVPGFLVTAVARVGGMAGPDTEVIRRVARSGIPVLAAGGIASLEHLRAARTAGAVGAVVGRAALEGRLDLGEAFAWAAA